MSGFSWPDRENLRDADDDPVTDLAGEPTVFEEFDDDEEEERDDALPEPTRFADVDDFVRNHLRHVYIRQVGTHSSNLHWCTKWWAVPEAVHRLHGIWRAWESLSADEELGLAMWYRDFCDPGMSELLAPDGPFQGVPKAWLASDQPGEPWTCEPAPRGVVERALDDPGGVDARRR